MSDSQGRALRLVAIVLVAAAALAVGPYWIPVMLAAWVADVLQPVTRRLQRVTRGKRRGATAAVVLLLVAIVIPLAGLTAALVVELGDLVTQARAALEGNGKLGGILLGGHAPSSPRQWIELVGRHGTNAWHAVTIVARTSTSALLGILVFVVALYAFAASGARTHRWLAHHSPLGRRALFRFVRAFRETGRGLIISGGGTALVQGAIATIAYVALGIPRALLLGPVTAVCALVPIVGTGIVWVPLAIELAATGSYARAGIMLAVGGVISVVDNFIRPFLTKYGHLRLPPSVVLVAMLGGIAVFGAAGVLIGPLAVRLAIEALAIVREQRVALHAFSSARSASEQCSLPS